MKKKIIFQIIIILIILTISTLVYYKYFKISKIEIDTNKDIVKNNEIKDSIDFKENEISKS